ncbi:SAM-dependent methyltransferase [Marinactinospora thermotolerans]|uniref:27-O-demethylrifamycin SV methyltransferase n=1 Tax=Marinactinospora thermotolerans DSM 45154 TaxID=1122192 RepID=A0A1T4LX61_9ACTN|nr:class I SAM-dependent methyltransferase [Marinactinospora thermotolerans]SJZ59078.1 27-O-demethylrifamycin SV methyltransferase [Marinactinospora thermotolerans DSM 45154]
MKSAWTDSFSWQEIESTYDHLSVLVEETAGPDRHYGYWEGDDDSASIEEATERMTDLVASRLGIRHGSRVLDVGCGNGRPAVRIAKTLGAEVVAVDVDRRALRNGTDHAREQGVAGMVRFEWADALDLPYAPASFDAVLLFETTPHFHIRDLYREAARMLRPGGRLVVETPYPRVPLTDEVRDRIGPYLTMLKAVAFDAPDEHVAAAGEAGLAVEEVTDITANTRDSFRRLVRGLRENRERLETEWGSSDARLLLDGFGAWAEADEVGAVVMVFTRTEG